MSKTRYTKAFDDPAPHVDTWMPELEVSEPANPKQAFGDRKIPLHLVPATAQVAIAIGLKEGARKYGAFNWRELPIEYMTYVGAVQRHLQAWIEGRDTDPDSGNPHLFHAIASLSILIDAVTCGNGIDNRPPPGAGARLIEEYSATPNPPD